MASKTKGRVKADNIVPQIRLALVRPGQEHEGSFGKGTAALLNGIKENGSLNKSAKGLGMAYSKAWRMMNEVDEEFGVKMILRDGAHGSTLTDDGERMLEVYEKLVAETEEFVTKRYKELIG